jgi:hypothetical protein
MLTITVEISTLCARNSSVSIPIAKDVESSSLNSNWQLGMSVRFSCNTDLNKSIEDSFVRWFREEKNKKLRGDLPMDPRVWFTGRYDENVNNNGKKNI